MRLAGFLLALLVLGAVLMLSLDLSSLAQWAAQQQRGDEVFEGLQRGHGVLLGFVRSRLAIRQKIIQ